MPLNKVRKQLVIRDGYTTPVVAYFPTLFQLHFTTTTSEMRKT